MAVHPGIHDDGYPQDDDIGPQDAYAIALLHLMGTLADLLAAYRQSLARQVHYPQQGLTEDF